MYRIFRIPAAQLSRLDAVLKDDLVGRQSVLTRDAKTLGIDGEGTILLVEGSAAGVGRAESLLQDLGKALTGPEAERAYARFRAQDEDAASGMGLIFGP